MARLVRCWKREQNSRLRAIEGHTSGGSYVGNTGTRADTLEEIEARKTAPGCPGAGYGGILTDVAVSADVCAVLGASVYDRLALLQRVSVYGDVVAALAVWAGGVVDVGPPQLVSVDDISLVFRALHCVPSFLPPAGLSVGCMLINLFPDGPQIDCTNHQQWP